MSTLGERILQARKRANLTQNDVSNHMQISRVSVTNWEQGKTKPARDKLPALATLLNVNIEWLLGPDGSTDHNNSDVKAANVLLPSRREMPNDVPVMGTAAGSHIRGAFQISMSPIDYVRRPPALMEARDIYALYVEGESMEPEFKPGQLIYVHSHKPPRIGDAIIVQCQNSDESVEATIGIYAKRTPEKIIIHKHNPNADIEIMRSTVKAIHKVLTTNELFGV